MKLYGTPLSHFSRKIRILLQELSVPFEFCDIGNVGENSDIFCNNPLMKVPVLKDSEHTVFDSDNIARYIVNKYNSRDRFAVNCKTPSYTNALVITSGVMEAEVKIILAQRAGMEDIYRYLVFQKARKTIENGLKWLNGQEQLFDSKDFTYLDISVVCMWDHLQHYKLFDLDYPMLKTLSLNLNRMQSFSRSKPT
ncbi:glutathione S-transferase family protein [Candidatus Uabimicrobium sp. HlEnr_7]|uniref:glutathione S-transferase family protein n=1 Tax=Candidatus Uabimicrobium helgolandensis TaxID=3095367 RepID=UPI003557464B